MGLFGIRKNKSFLGIDIGSTSIKLVELGKENGLPVLLTYGYAERAMSDIVNGDAKEILSKVAVLLKKLYTQAGADSYQAVTALPNFSVFNSVITLPMMSKKELDSAIHWEAKKFIPMPIEEVILDWRIIDVIDVDKKRKNYRILLTAAAKNLVKRYVEIFKQADLQLLFLETEAFALVRSLLGKSQATTMIIDTSAVTTDIIIIEKGVPALNRSIDVGGITISQAIANGLSIDFKRAEQFKRDIGMSGPSKISRVIEEILKPVVDEMSYSLRLYQDQSGKKVEQIILSGGSAYLPDLSDYFSKIMNIRVIVGNPWARISFNQELKPALDEVAPRFAVAIGLALREII
ncbi:MAG: type IV pilus assembly protein PilM [Patescibacteria group bacterium]|jgi:type IV pilus assembly protein PilM|nr:type IV pilus assembly protein PilM [Patescibacteria group bacterium]MDD5172834.1 type IV pilus assembly protein PilM [Patescibacteria group bacterium]